MNLCNYILDNGARCDSSFLLHEMYFRDPYYKHNCGSVNICKKHYDLITKEVNEIVIGFARQRDNLFAQRNRERQIAKENDTFYHDQKQYKIDDLKQKCRDILNYECRNYFCLMDLKKLKQEDKIYTVTSFKPGGKRGYTWNFCSFKCLNWMSVKCGIKQIVNTGQLTLDIIS